METTDPIYTQVNNLRGKYIKQLLQKLEVAELLNPVIRKHILDSFNDYTRELLVALGYEIE